MMKKKFTLLVKGALLILSISAQAQNGLFISEVTDPLDDYSGRFIELYNAGTEAVDFSTTVFYLSRQSNGGTSWGDVQLIGIVPAGETFVIGGSSFESIYGFAPDQETGILIGNGDDAYSLFSGGDHASGTLHDIFGVIDIDGTGEAWEYEDSRALRVETVTAPSVSWLAAEWVISSASIADGDPGTHNGSAATNPIPGDYSLVLQNDTVLLGQPVEVSLLVSELTVSDNIISYQFEVDFDPAVLNYTSTSIVGTLAESGSIVVNTNITGKLSVSYMNSTVIVGEGIIANIHFSSLIADTTLLTISNAMLNNIQLDNLSNSTVIIKNAVPSTAVITYDDTINRFADTLQITANFSEDMDLATLVKLNFSGAVTIAEVDMFRQSARVYTYEYPIPKATGDVVVRLSNGRDLWGNELVSIPTGGDTFSILEFRPGDVDDDGSIFAYDAALTLQYSVGLDPLFSQDPLPWENWRDSTANVDGTGGITANDAGMILQYSAGIILDFSGGNKKSLSFADISVEVVGNEIVFYSHGNLIGLNISAVNENDILSIPIALGKNYLSAKNIHESTYNVGLCTANPLDDGSVLMKIPFSGTGSITFEALVNTQEKHLTVDLVTGIIDSYEESISVYPNPAKDFINLSFGDFAKLEGGQIRILSLVGGAVYERRIDGPEICIDVSDLNGSGLYSVLLCSEDGEIVTSKKIIVQ
jgi:hypothetical protein